ncbi:tRNA (adenosine(37)-N6)-dimethylallyltransferase MiaA [Bifidobacterium sp.]|uniref:tRNA (adenosine(37)-N6)-dimethylallyltransferase MiaA n=1 Tax=Bifidobacterium sp. TaxID=41200 RepID=UPI0025C0E496|nr:tRNA (adenosine(37)-N6)-dimethylallyltransferase MiaA [Bifidobacterium sp.]MCI1225494.1 tRNA (adenosine(37)-N6)-dimethylallyltransferase MiaA [Bifidobacterium sp.]
MRAGGAAGVDPGGPRRVVSIIGPTASGKTGLAIALAQVLNAQMPRSYNDAAEIINADAYQMYRGMDIGTAKATAQERQAVPHHLIDIIEPEDSMSVANFQKLARACIGRLQEHGIRPILVGGSGLYARAAIDDIVFPATDPALRARLEERAESEGSGALYAELQAKDPQAAARMDPHNSRRTIRALEVIAITGKPYSASLPRYRYVMPAVQIGLDLPRDELDRRIDIRTQAMRRAGFVDEVRRLRPRLGITAARALGYQQILEALDGDISEDEAFAQIAQHTKRLARKQMGWFGRDPRIHWLDALDPQLVSRTLEIVQRADAGAYDEHDAHAIGYARHRLGDLSPRR